MIVIIGIIIAVLCGIIAYLEIRGDKYKKQLKEYRKYVHERLDYTKQCIDKIHGYHTIMTDKQKEDIDEIYSQLVDIKEDL